MKKNPLKSAKARAPATVANVAVGFDILGFAVDSVFETVEIKWIYEPKVVVNPVEGYPYLPLDPNKNTASAGLVRLIKDCGLKFGFELTLGKNIPLGSGLGGSCASAVASIVAANELLDDILTKEEMFEYALIREEAASGSRHGDNVAPCLYGGLTLVRSCNPVDIIQIPYPKDMYCVFITPNIRIDTNISRSKLSNEVPLANVIRQTSDLAGFMAGCYTNDYALIRRSLRDSIIEPQRAAQVPGFYEAQEAALKAGALGCSFSGSGPTIFALARSEKSALEIQKAIKERFVIYSVCEFHSWISPIRSKGAEVIEVQT